MPLSKLMTLTVSTILIFVVSCSEAPTISDRLFESKLNAMLEARVGLNEYYSDIARLGPEHGKKAKELEDQLDALLAQGKSFSETEQRHSDLLDEMEQLVNAYRQQIAREKPLIDEFVKSEAEFRGLLSAIYSHCGTKSGVPVEIVKIEVPTASDEQKELGTQIYWQSKWKQEQLLDTEEEFQCVEAVRKANSIVRDYGKSGQPEIQE